MAFDNSCGKNALQKSASYERTVSDNFSLFLRPGSFEIKGDWKLATRRACFGIVIELSSGSKSIYGDPDVRNVPNSHGIPNGQNDGQLNRQSHSQSKLCLKLFLSFLLPPHRIFICTFSINRNWINIQYESLVMGKGRRADETQNCTALGGN